MILIIARLLQNFSWKVKLKNEFTLVKIFYFYNILVGFFEGQTQRLRQRPPVCWFSGLSQGESRIWGRLAFFSVHFLNRYSFSVWLIASIFSTLVLLLKSLYTSVLFVRSLTILYFVILYLSWSDLVDKTSTDGSSLDGRIESSY